MVQTYKTTREERAFSTSLEIAICDELVTLAKAVSNAGPVETYGLNENHAHLGLEHHITHVLGNDVHHVFHAHDAANGVNGLMEHFRHRAQVERMIAPQYLGRNEQGNHVIQSQDHRGRTTYTHIKQMAPETPRGAAQSIPKPSWAKRATIALTRLKQGVTSPKPPAVAPPKFDANTNPLHSIAANHGIAHYDTQSRYEKNGQLHHSHLFTASQPSKSIQALHGTIAANHPTTDIRYNRVNVGGVTKHNYSFRHQTPDGVLHTTTVTKPATEHPGGKMEWQ